MAAGGTGATAGTGGSGGAVGSDSAGGQGSGATAWVTLLTRPGYVPGVLALRRSLVAVASAHPLVVMVTAAVDDASRQVLVEQGCLVREVAPVGPHAGLRAGYANARFAEVWTKLAVWGLTDLRRAVFLDADMLVVQNMDELFDVELPDGGIAACHACRCNPARIAGYPATWTPENCSYTRGRGVGGAEPAAADDYLNGGLLVLEPDAAVLEAMLGELAALDDLDGFPFAEQDFLDERYRGRWLALPYVYNALKTLPFQHPALWDLSAVRNLHFIIDKPWDKPVDPQDRYHALDQLWRDVMADPEPASP